MKNKNKIRLLGTQYDKYDILESIKDIFATLTDDLDHEIKLIISYFNWIKKKLNFNSSGKICT